MVRVGGMRYACDPTAAKDHRISNMTLHGKPIKAGRKYKVAGWAPVAEGASGQPIWEVVAAYLRSKKVIRPPRLNLPQLSGVSGNPGMA
jgi:sulfur-oxidizing protein SoxB